jgi:hypothetical protein
MRTRGAAVEEGGWRLEAEVKAEGLEVGGLGE